MDTSPNPSSVARTVSCHDERAKKAVRGECIRRVEESTRQYARVCEDPVDHAESIPVSIWAMVMRGAVRAASRDEVMIYNRRMKTINTLGLKIDLCDGAARVYGIVDVHVLGDQAPKAQMYDGRMIDTAQRACVWRGLERIDDETRRVSVCSETMKEAVRRGNKRRGMDVCTGVLECAMVHSVLLSAIIVKKRALAEFVERNGHLCPVVVCESKGRECGECGEGYAAVVVDPVPLATPVSFRDFVGAVGFCMFMVK